MRNRAVATVMTLVLAGASTGAGAQGQLRTVVIPADAGVVVPPRGAVPRLAARPPGVSLQPLPSYQPSSELPPEAGVLALGAAILPLAAAAILGGGSVGTRSGPTGPSRTR